MKIGLTRYESLGRRLIALLCLILFLSLFVVDNFSHILIDKNMTELVEFGNESESESEKDTEKLEKKFEDKFPGHHSISKKLKDTNESYAGFRQLNLNQQIQEVLSPPPEA